MLSYQSVYLFHNYYIIQSSLSSWIADNRGKYVCSQNEREREGRGEETIERCGNRDGA